MSRSTELYDGNGEGRQKIGHVRKYKLLDRTPYLLMLGKHLGAFPVTRPQQAEPPVAPGMVSLSHFKSLPLEQQLEMRQEMLTVMQKFAQPKVVNE